MHTLTPDVADLYDFAVPHRLGRDATAGLRRVHETMARDFEHALGASFGSEVRGAVVNIEQMRYERFVGRTPGRTYHALLDAPGFDCGIELLLPAPTALVLVDSILRTSDGPSRPITIVDSHLLETFLRDLTHAIGSALGPHKDPALRFGRSELNGKAVKLVPTDDVVLVVEIQFTVESKSLTFVFCYPQEPLMPLLAALSDLEREATTAAINTSPIGDSIRRVSIPVSVRLPSSRIHAADLNALRVGDVLQTGVSVDANPVLVIDGTPTLEVRTIMRSSRLACAVLRKVDTRDSDPEV